MKLIEAAARSLADFTSSTLIIPRLRSRTTIEVMRELAYVMRGQQGLADPLFPGVVALNRELLTSTSLDYGAAIAVVKLPSVPRPMFVLGCSPEPLPWRARTFPQIEFVFLVVRPARDDRDSNELVAALTYLAKNREHLIHLRNARTADELLTCLAGIPVTSSQEKPLA